MSFISQGLWHTPLSFSMDAISTVRKGPLPWARWHSRERKVENRRLKRSCHVRRSSRNHGLACVGDPCHN